ncbi:uncharacterized protein EV420DRAFT_1765001 [Desarmillaria tabescens]|uniref:Uncharacterized protein n=1 Tax=Armillaria tabescens TaxID=1929756 RepID=A0AA39KCF1_ARMTA|nr:uncharacterized protein EV420DRAFT_1765001 [Desarmillaria tabescens]KAK0457254.1 hypothetical protein EV420DRAFT_1765001 [Desarmillaria tabescens]
MLESLLDEQKRVLEHISDSKLVLNPIRRLLPEFLNHIVRSCILRDSELLRSSNGDRDASLLDSLGHPSSSNFTDTRPHHFIIPSEASGTYLERSGPSSTQRLTVAIEIDLFSRLDLLGLLELRIAFSYTEEEIIFPEFTSETAPMLEDLCIQIDDSNIMDSEALTCLLKYTPLLTDLKISAKVTTDDVFLQLGRKRDILRLVPQLCSIDLTGSTFEFEDASNIVIGMVTSRTEPAEGCVALRTLISDKPFCFEDDDLSTRWETRRLGQDSLDIQYDG